MEKGPICAEGSRADDRRPPPGDFISQELREDTARFLAELRRRAERKQRLMTNGKTGPPPADR